MQSCELETTPGTEIKGRNVNSFVQGILSAGWVLTVFLPLTLVLVFILVIHGPYTIYIWPSDQRLVEPVSRIMCRDIDIHSTDPLNSILINAPPIRNKDTLNVTSPDLSFDLGGRTKRYRYWSFELLSDSVIEFELLKPVSNVTYFEIRGDDSYAAWKTKMKCASPENCRSVSLNVSYAGFSLRKDIRASDVYYFIFRADDNETEYLLQLSISMYRRTYKLQSNHWCKGSRECSLRIYPKTYQRIFIEYYPDYTKKFSPANVTIHCYPQIWLYCLEFLVVPFVFGVVMSATVRYLQHVYEICAITKTPHRESVSGMPAINDTRRELADSLPCLSDVTEETASVCSTCGSRSPLLPRFPNKVSPRRKSDDLFIHTIKKKRKERLKGVDAATNFTV